MTRFTKITSNRNRKFDLQLGKALDDEDRLAQLFQNAKIELKTERYQWKQYGNLAIEFMCDHQPSGISTTECDLWIHELRWEDRLVGYYIFPIEWLKEKCRREHARGNYRHNSGDDGRFSVILLRITELWD
jgi:hypothetical protein